MTRSSAAGAMPDSPWWRRFGAASKDAFRLNLSLKIIAAAAAMAAWLLAQSQPTAEEYATIQLEYSWPEGLVAADAPVNEVLVKARGPRANLRELSRRDLRYRVDLADATVGETTVNLTAVQEVLPTGVEIITISPSALAFRFDERITRALPVKVPTSGEVAFGYEVREIVVEPDVVTLSGARPELEPLEEVRTRTLDLTGKDRDFAEILSLDLGARRIRPEHDAEVSVYVKLSQIVEERELELTVTVPDSHEGIEVTPAKATVVLRGPARELHRIRGSSLRVYLDEGELTFKGGTAEARYSEDETQSDQVHVHVSTDGLPQAVKVIGVTPETFTLKKKR